MESSVHSRIAGLLILPLLLGILFFAASLTPSLIPRSWIAQGVLGGIVMGVGYMIGQIIRMIWRALELPWFSGIWARRMMWIAAIPVIAILLLNLNNNLYWQNGIRAKFGMPLLENSNLLLMLISALLVFTILVLLGTCAQWIFNWFRHRLYRYVPPRTANVAAVLLAGILILWTTQNAVIGPMMNIADGIYEAGQHLLEPEAPRPTEGWKTGSAESLVNWEKIGTPGRNFIRLGPDADAISAFNSSNAKNPLRIYVGRAEHNDPQVRAQIALNEMMRVGAFDRKILIIASPTGTGWLDAGSHDVLEYLHDGDVATVAVQYSYLQSPLALIFETQSGLEQAKATVRTVYDHWKTLSPATRPRLYIHGLSLGAWSSMNAVNILQLINNPIDGAFWAGPPFPSGLWQEINANRKAGSPYVLPEIDDGNLVRYMSQFPERERRYSNWGRMRIVFLQYASDAIVFFESGSFWNKPVWMEEKPAEDVWPSLSFMPFVTQFQLAVDMAFSANVPRGFGHHYDADDYVDGWVWTSAPEGWTDKDLQRLKEHCGGDWGDGCRNQ